MHLYAYASRAAMLARIVELEHVLAEIVGQDIPGPVVDLTERQRRLVSALLAYRGRVITRAGLLAAIYYDRPDPDWPGEKIIDVLVCKIRRRLDPNILTIRTVIGRGYVIDRSPRPD